MKTFESYVKVLSSMDSRKEAWKTSRPMFSEENLNFDKVAEMDLSLNSMLIYTFEMRSSVIVRDLIFSLRPIEGWALSTRSMPVSLDTVRLSEEFYGSKDYNGITEMFDLMKDGASRDQARGVLPCSASSTYTFTMDFRVLMSFCKAMKELSPSIFGLYCVPMMKASDTLAEFETTTVKSSLEYYKIQDCEKINGIQEVGNMIVGHYPMKMALASQFLRQHYSKIKIGLWNLLEDEPYLTMGLDQNSIVDVVFYIDKNSYHRLMAMRSHWVIDHAEDMWGGLVSDYIESQNMTTEDFWNFIPAGGGKTDPYWADCYNRITLEDPGVPCPIMTEWRGSIQERLLESPDNKVLPWYDKLFEEGFVKDNALNKHRCLYFDNLANNGGIHDNGVS